MHATRLRFVLALAGLMTLAAGNPALAEEKPFDVKSTFRNICGFCHEDYGRKAGKGPQLMNSERTDQELFDRIKHGKPGRMAAFGAVFTDEQIAQTVKFIRNLKPNEEPRNP
jgi:mono/diheme cytochrome c family protein